MSKACPPTPASSSINSKSPTLTSSRAFRPPLPLEQRSGGGSPRSTIATATEIYDYLRLLYASVGQPHDPATGWPLRRQTPQGIVDRILEWPAGSKVVLLAPLVRGQTGEFRDVLEKARREGFVRVRVDGKIIEVDAAEPCGWPGGRRTIRSRGRPPGLAGWRAHPARRFRRNGLALGQEPVGRVAAGAHAGRRRRMAGSPLLHRLPGSGNRLYAATAYRETFLVQQPLRRLPGLPRDRVAAGAGSGIDGARSAENAGRRGGGPGAVPSRSGCARFTRTRSAAWPSASRRGWTGRSPQLPEAFRHALFHGTGPGAATPTKTRGKAGPAAVDKPFEGLVAQLQHLLDTTRSELTRHRLRAYTSPHPCPACHGARLRPEILAVTLAEAAGKKLNIRKVDACLQGMLTAARPAYGWLSRGKRR